MVAWYGIALLCYYKHVGDSGGEIEIETGTYTYYKLIKILFRSYIRVLHHQFINKLLNWFRPAINIKLIFSPIIISSYAAVDGGLRQ